MKLPRPKPRTRIIVACWSCGLLIDARQTPTMPPRLETGQMPHTCPACHQATIARTATTYPRPTRSARPWRFLHPRMTLTGF